MTLLALAVSGRGVVDPSEPVFHADDDAVVRGTAAFETIRVRGGRPVLLDRHVARLERSSASLRLPPPDGAAALALEAVAAAGAPEAALRLFRTSETLVATVAELPADLEARRRQGIALVTVGIHARGLLAGIKSTSYGANMAALAEARERGADDALFVDEGGTVLEATTANVWWRAGGVLATPALSTGVLPGVTRGAVAELAAAEGYEVREGTFALGELRAADEAFTTSAVREVMPVVSLDGALVGTGAPGGAARRLQLALERLGAAG